METEKYEYRPKVASEKDRDDARPTLETKEHIPNTVDRIGHFVKCTILRICDEAKVTQEAREAVREIREAPMVVSLDKLRSHHSHIGDTSMSRFLLFGPGANVREKYGSFASPADRELWGSLMKMPPIERAKHPLYEKMSNKRGTSIEIPENARIDFRKNLRELWELKLQKYEARNPTLRTFYETKIMPVIDHPKSWTRTTLEKYVREIDADIDEVIRAMGGLDGYEKTLMIQKEIRSPDKIKLLGSIVREVRGVDLVAVSITEIMDKTKGPFNLALFDAMLRYGGKEYVSHIPALGDPYVSFGNYQHTKFSVG